MTTNTESERPIFRVTFSCITGQHDQGRDVLARPREIGAVWARKGGKAGGIVSFDIIPVELAHRQGVLFLVPVGNDEAAE
jgi:hypothetical protein